MTLATLTPLDNFADSRYQNQAKNLQRTPLENVPSIIIELYNFIHFQQTDRALQLLSKNREHLPINTPFQHETILHLACKLDNQRVVESILTTFRDRINVNVHDTHTGMTPLHYACQNGNQKITYLLLKTGANANAVCSRHHTPAHLAAESGSLNCLYLLKKFLGRLDEENKFGNRPLHRAALKNQYKVIDYLCSELNADSSRPNCDHQPPLYMAIINKSKDAVLNLCGKYNANVNAQVSTILNRSMLHIAIKESDYDIAQYLVCKGANVNAVDNDNLTPLHYSVESQHVEMTRFLLDNNADVNVPSAIDIYTPLHLAAKYGSIEIIRALIERGADVNALSQDGQTPLHLSCMNGHAECCRILLENKAKRNITDLNGKRPLDYVANLKTRQVFEERSLRWPSWLQVDTTLQQGRIELKDATPVKELNLFPRELVDLKKKFQEKRDSEQRRLYGTTRKIKKRSSPQKTQFVSSPLTKYPGEHVEDEIVSNSDSSSSADEADVAPPKLLKSNSTSQLAEFFQSQQNRNPNLMDANYLQEFMNQLELTKKFKKKVTLPATSNRKSRSNNTKRGDWDPHFVNFNALSLKGVKKNDESTGRKKLRRRGSVSSFRTVR